MSRVGGEGGNASDWKHPFAVRFMSCSNVSVFSSPQWLMQSIFHTWLSSLSFHSLSPLFFFSTSLPRSPSKSASAASAACQEQQAAKLRGAQEAAGGNRFPHAGVGKARPGNFAPRGGRRRRRAPALVFGFALFVVPNKATSIKGRRHIWSRRRLFFLL